jgi:hypothetical protein
MQVTFGGGVYKFRPWRPSDGRVFDRTFAFDTETTLIDDERPWLTPAYVLGGAFDGRVGYFVPRDRVGAFLAAHSCVEIVMHNAPFDLAVLDTVAPGAGVYDRLDRDGVYDTQLMHKLLTLGTVGQTASGKGESTLDRCAELYLGVPLPKEVADSSGRDVRTSYGVWLGRPPAEIEEPYLRYLATDAISTYGVFEAIRERLISLLDAANETWGFVSTTWLADSVRRWGWQTHHLQLKAAIALRAVTANGLTLDTAARERLAAGLGRELERLKGDLGRDGYLPGEPGAGKALQAILRTLEAARPGAGLPRTPTGKYATSHDALGELAGRIPFLKTLFEYDEAKKLLGCFVGKMAKPVIHPSFNVLARTGRTTSYGELNAQNLPRDDAVRGCFVPSPGHVFIKADYATIEMATLAQAATAQFGLRSEMREAINSGKDLHRLVAARVTGKPEAEVTDDERQMAKPINFGKPGAMGLAALKQYAKASYGIDLSDSEVVSLSDAWLGLFPEMADFLRDEGDLGRAVAEFFALTPDSHHAHTGSRKFSGHPANAFQTHRPHPILGGMLLKVLKEPAPVTSAGKPYSPADIDYLWAQVEGRADALPTTLHGLVTSRQPSAKLQGAVLRVAGHAPVFTLTGRLRAGASFAARRNTVFQGLAADGAKLALWRLWRAGYRVVNFIHDEVLVEVPVGDDLRRHAEEIRRHMVEGMREVVPDVKVDVEYAACDRWYKKAKPVMTPDGRGLAVWRPATSDPSIEPPNERRLIEPPPHSQ